jgi:hypothetical protein
VLGNFDDFRRSASLEIAQTRAVSPYILSHRLHQLHQLHQIQQDLLMTSIISAFFLVTIPEIGPGGRQVCRRRPVDQAEALGGGRGVLWWQL